jgi:Sec-independent protein translocase protein TatA
MRISGVFRLALLAAAAVSALSLPASASNGRGLAVQSDSHVAHVAAMLTPVHETRELAAEPTDEEEDEVEETAEEAEETPAPTHKKKHKKKKATTTDAPAATEAAVEETEAPVATTQAPVEETPAPTTAKKHKKKKQTTDAPATEEEDETETETPAPTTAVNEKKIKGDKNEGVIDGSSEGSSEIDKIDLRNQDGWVSVYDDPPLLVIKASLYAFISYNNTEVCDTFNMTMNAVEQKPDGNGTFSYHVVAYINCTKDGEDETQGRFILNFIPEGKRLLLTECGHREEGEIVNWLRIQEEVPECMTPSQRKKFLAQPMKHIHASNGTATDTEATQTDFLSRLEDFDTEEVAVVGTATVALIAVVVVLVVFVMRKRKAQKDLERTIAGAKAEHAVEDDDLQTEAEEKPTKERKGLMDSSKAKSDDPEMEEGSFVNSPAVRV